MQDCSVPAWLSKQTVTDQNRFASSAPPPASSDSQATADEAVQSSDTLLEFGSRTTSVKLWDTSDVEDGRHHFRGIRVSVGGKSINLGELLPGT